MELIEYRSTYKSFLERLKRSYYAAIAASIQITWESGWSGHIVESHQMQERKAHTMEYFGYLRLFETLS